MAEIHGVKRILGTIFDAIDSEYGGEVRDGLRLHLPKQFSLVVTRLDNDMIEVAFAPPADLYVKKLFLTLHGTLERVVLSKDKISVEIGKLPDQEFRIVS